MERQKNDLEKILLRLKYFNYKYELKDSRLDVYLPMFCYLRVYFTNGSVRMTSRIRFGLNFLSLEYNFLMYALGFYFLTSLAWNSLNQGFVILLGLFVVYFVVCFIKIETLKSVMHSWIEKDFF